MKAIVQTSYGRPEDVLRLEEIARPAPGPGQVLVAVRAASVHADVWHVVNGYPYALRLMGAGVRRPKNPVPGTDLAGVVEAVGAGVTQFRPGDAVFGESSLQMQWTNGGTYAEFAVAAASALAAKPANVTFEQAAAVPTAGYIALLNLRASGQLHAGRRALINGAAGGVGSTALQIAKAHGLHVTAVDAGDKLAQLQTLGADAVIDYTRGDVTQRGERYDLIFDVASTLSLAQAKRALTPTGTYVLIGHDHYGATGARWFGSLPRFIGLMLRTPFERHLPKASFALPPKGEVAAVLGELLETGKLTPIIDRVFPLAEAPAAVGYLAAGAARGRIVVAPGEAADGSHP